MASISPPKGLVMASFELFRAADTVTSGVNTPRRLRRIVASISASHCDAAATVGLPCALTLIFESPAPRAAWVLRQRFRQGPAEL